MDENLLKTKKQHPILTSPDNTLPNWNSSDDNKARSSNSETNIHRPEITGGTEDKKFDETNNKRKPITDCESKTIMMSEDNSAEKTRFEEIEDKLEEMFAGIEDEQLRNATPDEKTMSKPLDESLDKYLKVNCNDTNVNNNKKKSLIENQTNKSSHPTKASQKSATSVSNTTTTNQLKKLFKNYNNNPVIPKSMLYLKTMPPRRRLSIGINKELLNLSLKSSDKVNKIKPSNNNTTESEDIGQLPFKMKGHGHVKCIKKKVPTNKITNKNQKKCGNNYKREMAYIKSNTSGNKQKPLKSDAPIKDKQSRLKVKQARMQRLPSSETDTEEKQLQVMDAKHRSPYILVKNNGCVTVVNTVSPDDSNDKSTRSKKTNNYAFERKTVKGCYSSTLGNRYDADTADLSWKCVFCKIGPHKKGLGDLFGPYIISSNCEEYRSTKDHLENFQQLRRNDVKLMEISHKLVNDISKSNCEYLFNSSTSGMSQLSLDCYEIWLHEECAIWAPTIFIVGSRLTGLEEATWNSTRYECVYCLKSGALLCCLQRECKATSHVPCAREFKWLFDESNFWVYCNKHAITSK